MNKLYEYKNLGVLKYYVGSSFFNSDVTSLGVSPSIAEAVHMSSLITQKIGTTAPHSPLILGGKILCGIRSSILRGVHGTVSWDSFMGQLHGTASWDSFMGQLLPVSS